MEKYTDKPSEATEDRQYDPEKYNQANLLQEIFKETCTAELVEPIKNTLWTLKGPVKKEQMATPEDLWRPDLLHTLDLGLIKYAMDWVISFCEQRKPLAEVFDALWVAVTDHPSMKRKFRKQWRSYKQKQGAEYRAAARLVAAVFEATVESVDTNACSQDERQKANQALNAITALTDFHLMAQYPTHTYLEEKPVNPRWKDTPACQRANRRSSLYFMQMAYMNFFDNKEAFTECRITPAMRKKAKEQALKQYPPTPDEELAELSPSCRRAKLHNEAMQRKFAEIEFLEEH
ncbi:hypothetical protein BJ508DRAFT_316306, partial [Ascobolus immersus RN42]